MPLGPKTMTHCGVSKILLKAMNDVPHLDITLRAFRSLLRQISAKISDCLKVKEPLTDDTLIILFHNLSRSTKQWLGLGTADSWVTLLICFAIIHLKSAP